MTDKRGAGAAKPSDRSEETPPDLFAARVAVTRESFDELLRKFDLDIGCRPHVDANPDGTGKLLVYATQERIREIESAGYSVEVGENVSELGRQRQAEVGKGDRFEGGRIAPRGLGRKSGRGDDGATAQ